MARTRSARQKMFRLRYLPRPTDFQNAERASFVIYLVPLSQHEVGVPKESPELRVPRIVGKNMTFVPPEPRIHRKR